MEEADEQHNAKVKEGKMYHSIELCTYVTSATLYVLTSPMYSMCILESAK